MIHKLKAPCTPNDNFPMGLSSNQRPRRRYFDILPVDIDDANTLILEEVGRIGVASNITITPEEFKYFWNKVKEGTSSSISGIHFGHNKRLPPRTMS